MFLTINLYYPLLTLILRCFVLSCRVWRYFVPFCWVMPCFMSFSGGCSTASKSPVPAALGVHHHPAWHRWHHWHQLIKYLWLLLCLTAACSTGKTWRGFLNHAKPTLYFQCLIQPLPLCFHNIIYFLMIQYCCSIPPVFLPYRSFLWTLIQSLRFQRTQRFSQAGLAAGRCPWVCLYTLDYCEETQFFIVTVCGKNNYCPSFIQ